MLTNVERPNPEGPSQIRPDRSADKPTRTLREPASPAELTNDHDGEGNALFRDLEATALELGDTKDMIIFVSDRLLGYLPET